MAVPRSVAAVLVGTFVSVLGASATSLALVLAAASSGPSWRVTEVFLAELLPPLLLAPALGALVDRYDARRVWIASTVGQAGLLLAAAGLGQFHAWVALVGASGVLAVASTAAAFKLLPTLAGSAGIGRVNGLMSAVSSSAFLVGPAAGAVAYAAVGARPVFLVNAATSAVVALVVVRAVPHDLDARTDLGHAPRQGALDGWRLLRRSPLVGPLVPLLGAVVLTTSVEGVAGVFYLREVSGSDVAYGLLLSLWALGSIPGALLGGTRLLEGRDRLLVVGGAALIAGALLVEGLVPSVWVIGAAFVVGGIGNGAHNVGVRTSIHRGVPAAAHGRAWACYATLSNTCVALGFLLGTPTSVLGSRELVVLSGAVATLVTVTAALTVGRRLLDRSPRTTH